MCPNYWKLVASILLTLTLHLTVNCSRTTTGIIFTTSTNHSRKNVKLIQSGIINKNPNTGKEQLGNRSSSHPPVLGSVINIFPRYGYASLSIRVVPRNDSQSWLFLEPFKTNIFDMSTIDVQEKMMISNISQEAPASAPPAPSPTLTQNKMTVEQEIKDSLTLSVLPKFHNEFHIQLCEDIHELLEAYFRYFKIEGFDKAWNVFGAGWRTQGLVKVMGIDSQFTNDTEFFYVFVRVSMMSRIGQSVPKTNLTISRQFEHILETLQVGSYSSAMKFFNDIGTHYISAYNIGNSLYQVFVYDRYGFEAIKAHLSETVWNSPEPAQPSSNNGQTDKNSYSFGGILTSQTLTILYYWVRHIGKVMVLNSRAETVERIRNELLIPFSHSSNSSIFKLFDNITLVKKIENDLMYESEGLIGLELRNIGAVFRNESRKKWFLEVLQNTMSLWESNL